MSPVSARLPRAAWGPLLLLAVYACAVTSVLFRPAGTTVAVWWPAAGVAVILLVLSPRDRWWWALAAGVAVSSGLANLTGGRPPSAALGLGLANAAEAVVVALWLTRGRTGRPRLRTQEELTRLFTGAALGGLAVGLGVGLTVALTLEGSPFASALTVTLSHAASVLVILPLVAADLRAPSGRDLRELVAQWTVVLTGASLVFGPVHTVGFSFMLMPALVWGALRLGLRTSSLQLVVLGVLTTACTVHGWGPFAVVPGGRVTSPDATGPLLQAFLVACAVIVLPLAVAVEQRRVALAQVSASEELFRRSFSDSLIGMVLLRLDAGRLRVIEANPTAARILGDGPDALVGADWAAMLRTGTDLDEVVAGLLDGRADGWREELGLQRDPHVRLSVALSPLAGGVATDGAPRFTAQMADITAEHEATLRMRSEMDFTSAILDTAGCLIVVVAVDGTVVGLNRAAQETTGFTEEDVVDRPLWEVLVPPDDRARVRGGYAEPGGARVPLDEEADLATRSGRKRRVQWSSAFLTDEEGRATHVVMTGIDVTAERTTSGMLDHLMEAATTTAFVGCDLAGRITVVNEGARQMFGRHADEVVGRPLVGGLLDPDEAADLDLRSVEAPLTRDWTVRRADGSAFVLSLTLTRVLDASGDPFGYLGVGTDVTERRRQEELLQETLDKERQAVEQLRALDQAKDDFVSTVSHELRTPITSIVGYVEMLQDGDAGELTPEQSRLVDVVRRNGQRLISLAEDLLALSSLDDGSMALEHIALDLRAVVHRVQESLAPVLAGRALDVGFEVPDAPVPVLGDAVHLERAVLNLVGNAVKFTDDGGTVRCTLDTCGERAVLAVSDTGIGIPEAEQQHLFRRFFRSTTAQQHAIQGTGLGLAIVEQIVSSHEGRIGVESAPGAGTTFTVELPLAAPAGVHVGGRHAAT